MPRSTETFLKLSSSSTLGKVISHEQLAKNADQKLAENNETLGNSCHAFLHPDNRAANRLDGDEGSDA